MFPQSLHNHSTAFFHPPPRRIYIPAARCISLRNTHQAGYNRIPECGWTDRWWLFVFVIIVSRRGDLYGRPVLCRAIALTRPVALMVFNSRAPAIIRATARVAPTDILCIRLCKGETTCPERSRRMFSPRFAFSSRFILPPDFGGDYVNCRGDYMESPLHRHFTNNIRMVFIQFPFHGIVHNIFPCFSQFHIIPYHVFVIIALP